jgi:hypothetical protein
MWWFIAAATLGIDVGWQPTETGGVECIIQIEPHAVDGLLQGESLITDIPPWLQGAERWRFVVGEAELPRSEITIREVKPSVASPATILESEPTESRTAARPKSQSKTAEAATEPATDAAAESRDAQDAESDSTEDATPRTSAYPQVDRMNRLPGPGDDDTWRPANDATVDRRTTDSGTGTIALPAPPVLGTTPRSPNDPGPVDEETATDQDVATDGTTPRLDRPRTGTITDPGGVGVTQPSAGRPLSEGVPRTKPIMDYSRNDDEGATSPRPNGTGRTTRGDDYDDAERPLGAKIQANRTPRDETSTSTLDSRTGTEKAPPVTEMPIPWTAWTLALLGLFVSLGGNLYLGWMTHDLHRRYFDMVRHTSSLLERESAI